MSERDSTTPGWRRSAGVRLGVWGGLTVLVGLLGWWIGSSTVVPGPWSREALERNPGERAALAHGVPPREVVLLLATAPSGDTIDSEPHRATLDRLVDILRSVPASNGADRLFDRVSTVGHSMLEEVDELFLSEDKTTALIRAHSRVPVYEASSVAPLWQGPLDRFRIENPEFAIKTLSYGGGDREIFDLIHRDLDRSLLITIPVTAIILVWVFGSPGAAFLPLFIACGALALGLGGAAVLSHVIGPISATANQLVVLLVLALGVDYSLFFLCRVREECDAGRGYHRAIRIARQTTGRAILWSGLTVGVSLIGLFLMDDAVLTSMASVSIVAVGVVVAITLHGLPSLLMVLPQTLLLRKCTEGDVVEPMRREPGMNRVVRFSISRPWAALVYSCIPLFWLVHAAQTMRFGSSMERELLPVSMETRQAFEVLRDTFPRLSGTPLSVILAGKDLSDREDEGELQPFLDGLLEDGSVVGPIESERSEDGELLRLSFLVSGSANDESPRGVVERIRDSLVPMTITPLGFSGWASGNLPYVVDETARYLERTPAVVGVVLFVSMVVLLLAFRSIVVPIKAFVLNLISTGAAFGVLALLFQSSTVPHWNFGVVEGFVPALLFSILFGLSMDYHILLLSRAREEWLMGGDPTVAVERAVLRTFRPITGAAIIMTSVFVIVASLELPVMRQLGVGLAAAVILDATIIRAIVLPASMVLLGRWNWYLPGRKARGMAAS